MNCSRFALNAVRMTAFQKEVEFNIRTLVEISLLILFATVHGWVGAWLAVRMLFRPRNPIKLLGITIFPQGMIPRHRDRLANAIGKAVGEELVSSETVLDQLFEKDFLRRKIQGLVDSYTQELISQEYPSLIEALPSNLREPVLDAISTLQLKIGTHIQTVLKSEDTVQSISGFVERRVDEFLSKRVSEVIDEEQFNKALNFLETRIRNAVREPSLEKKIADFISKRVDDLANTQTTLGDMFTPDAIALVKEKAVEQIDPIITHLTQLAAAEKTRNQIGAIIKKEVHEYYEGLPFIKKIFVSRETLLNEVDDLVNESLPKRIEETLRGDFFAEEAFSFIDTSVNNVLARPLQSLIGQIAPNQLERVKKQITTSVLGLLQSDEMQKSISAYLTDSLHKIRPHSLDAILQTIHPESEEKLKKMLSGGLLNILNQEETANIINAVLAKQIEKLMAAPIGKLSDHISEDQIKKTGNQLTDTILQAAKEKLPQAIQEFNVGEMVREKINNYPVEKLESLVLSVAKEHLRTIELFGAFFGFVIGVVQAILSYYVFVK
ncbi:MAG: DUF445 domain-containing protein [Pyrinomonadaceae bacterium]|nr:DUF445 domain-containing protein [Pyrinomonadaceae bacterium]